MALFDVPTLIKQLQALDPNEDPFAFLADKILAGTDQGWTTGHTIVVSICSALWWGSLLANGTAIVRRWRAGELCFVRRQASRLGNFYIPHVTSLWSAIQIPVGLAFQLSIGIMLFEAYGRPLRYSFGLRNIVYMVSIPLAWTQVVNTLSGSLVAYASHSSRLQSPSQSFNLAPFANAFGLLMPTLSMAAHASLQVLATIHLASALDRLDAMVRLLRGFSATWQPGSGLPLQQLLQLQPIAERLPHHLDLFQEFTLWWAVSLLIFLGIALLVVIPAGAYQILDIYRQLQQLRSARFRQVSSIYSTSDIKQTPFQRLKAALFVRYSNQHLYSNHGSSMTAEATQLMLLESVCRNVIAGSSYFVLSCLGLIPLSAYGILRLSNGGTGNFSLLATLQVVALAELTGFFAIIDLILFLRGRLTGHLPTPPAARPSTRQAIARIPVHQVSFDDERQGRPMDSMDKS